MIGEISCRGMHFRIDAFAEFEFDALHFVVELQPHPKAFFHTKIAGQAEVVFWSATATTVLHLREMRCEYAGGFRDVFCVAGHSSSVSRRVSANALGRCMVFMVFQW